MKLLTSISLLCLLSLVSCVSAPPEKDFNRQLPFGAPALLPVLDESEWPDLREGFRHREELLGALERSIDWMTLPSSESFFPIEGVSHARAQASLERFRTLLLESPSAESFDAALHREFDLYMSAGWDGRGGGVLFTGYYTPILDGSLVETATHHYPLYGLPNDLVKGSGGAILGRSTDAGLEPYPTRATIEASGMLRGKGLELVWFANPLDAFIAHVNGSAIVRLTDGSEERFGYAGNNGREYTSLARELVAAGELTASDCNLPALRRWARENPDKVDRFLARNERYVFFTPIDGNPRGSLNVEVTEGRTLATDKTIFPRGGVVFVTTHPPGARYVDGLPLSRFLLDQDTGGAIRTAGRADVYFGIGEGAEELAGEMKAEGQLYYLFLDEQ